jgi:hypothetical protein
MGVKKWSTLDEGWTWSGENLLTTQKPSVRIAGRDPNFVPTRERYTDVGPPPAVEGGKCYLPQADEAPVRLGLQTNNKPKFPKPLGSRAVLIKGR